MRGVSIPQDPATGPGDDPRQGGSYGRTRKEGSSRYGEANSGQGKQKEREGETEENERLERV